MAVNLLDQPSHSVGSFQKVSRPLLDFVETEVYQSKSSISLTRSRARKKTLDTGRSLC